ncbi:Carboxylic ester hydrolase [Mycena sanguinolenta]|uniref:Carboxylic ester hydrolase n=1 Tax=Mycena sanguinolenta TaxID=230812 RepID=A0A8H7CVX0_9AGAR|nr:Carboxylic ester hydrolase [Mycena sanguinolenta]
MEFSFKFISQLLTSGLPLLSSWNPGENHKACLTLKSNLKLENTTVIDVSYVPAGSKVSTLGTCAKTADVNVPLCRVQFSTKTTDTSVVHAEAWLPDEWYGRFLGTGNGGLGGCIDYPNLDYGSALHFATVGSNNGHDGGSGSPFLGHPEVINDFAFRAIHVETVIGKQIVEAYYGRPHSKSYYLGCSTGGRQGTQAALKFPEDFDGIIAGAPATDFNHLVHWTNILASYVGAPAPDSSPAFIPPELWKTVAAEVMRQCDGLDGVLDGIVTEPDACDFRPEALLCRSGAALDACLTPPQVEALRKIYSPLYGSDSELLYPRFDPGAEPSDIFNGQFPDRSKEWVQYAVLNDTDFDFRHYGAKQAVQMDSINPGGIATFDGDLSAFRDRGGKFLTYHGRIDSASAFSSLPQPHTERFPPDYRLRQFEARVRPRRLHPWDAVPGCVLPTLPRPRHGSLHIRPRRSAFWVRLSLRSTMASDVVTGSFGPNPTRSTRARIIFFLPWWTGSKAMLRRMQLLERQKMGRRVHTVGIRIEAFGIPWKARSGVRCSDDRERPKCNPINLLFFCFVPALFARC